MFQKSTTKPLVKVASVFTVLVLLAGCSTPAKTKADSGPQPTADASIAKELLPFYEQKVAWKLCAEDDKSAYCGFVEVPANWTKPAGERLKLAVAYRKAAVDAPLGSILLNPGGPGSSGVSMLRDAIAMFGAENKLLKNFNMVGFDPRGVANSEPKVKCLDDKEKDKKLYGRFSAEIGSAAHAAELRAEHKKYVAACVKNTGSNLQFVDTLSAARDMDVIRAVFGDSKMNYLGYSYGTYLGTTYASLFPKRVGRMVLDGAVDPMNLVDMAVNQVKGFDLALNNFLTDCVGKSKKECPFTGDVASAKSQIIKLLRSLEKKPLKTDLDRKLEISAGVTGIIMALYNDQFWTVLRDAFKKALKGDGTVLLQLADGYNQRNEDGTYKSNIGEAYVAINCVDYRSPSDDASIAAENKKMLAASNVFGRYMQFDALTCEQWPYPVVAPPKSYAATGSDKILVIGTTGDPSTPYQQAVSLATKVLANAQMITFHGEGHTIYGDNQNECIDNVVDNYFIKGIVPTKDPQCKKSE